MVNYFSCFAGFYAALMATMALAKAKSSASKLAWGFAAGSISGILLFVKDGMDLIATNGIGHWQCWFFLLMAAFVGLLGLFILSRCMKR